MRKLLNTLFVTSDDVYLALENENVAVFREDEKVGLFPLLSLEGIVSFSYKGASPALMGACAERGIQLAFMSPQGRFQARVCGKDRGNVLLRKQQYRISEDLTASCGIARNFIFGKIYNNRWIVERVIRDHALRVDSEKLKKTSKSMANQLKPISEANDLDVLRGLEGQASGYYFSIFDQMILNQKEDFYFHERTRRPPRDPMNALLSFGYTILANDCAVALESVGLDSYVGFLHRDRPGRASLALDLMEELRGPMVDRLALSLINMKKIQTKHFLKQADGAVMFNDEGRKIFLSTWQERKRETIQHPYLKEKIYRGLIPYVQALLLARYLRNDLDGYPPFLWK